jgi:hypothetical protein
VRVDAEVDLDAFALGSGFDKAADGGGCEPLTSNQGGDIRLAEDEPKIHLVLTRVADAELGELRIADKLEGDVLDEVLDLSGDLFHSVRFCRSVDGVSGNEKELFGMKK